MKVAFIALNDMLCEWMVGGLKDIGHEVEFIRLNGLLTWPLEHYAKLAKPDLIVSAPPAGGNFAPTTETYKRLRDIAPSVLLAFDASDVGWHGLLSEYRAAKCFDLYVNCDGCEDWPKENGDLTLCSPVGDSFYNNQRPVLDRPIRFGFCGGHRSDPRFSIVNHLVRNAGLYVRPRDPVYGGYQEYADFLQQCRIVLNICYSAGGPHGQDKMTKQLKARVVETGFAGACLLETRGSPAEKHFIPGVDFLAYDTKEEAEHIVKTASPEYIAKCAANLQRKVKDKFSPVKFWGQVMEALQK